MNGRVKAAPHRPVTGLGSPVFKRCRGANELTAKNLGLNLKHLAGFQVFSGDVNTPWHFL